MEQNTFLFGSVSYLNSDEAFDSFSTVALAGHLLTSALLSRSHQYSSSDLFQIPFLSPLGMNVKCQSLRSLAVLL